MRIGERAVQILLLTTVATHFCLTPVAWAEVEIEWVTVGSPIPSALPDKGLVSPRLSI